MHLHEVWMYFYLTKAATANNASPTGFLLAKGNQQENFMSLLMKIYTSWCSLSPSGIYNMLCGQSDKKKSQC